MRSYYNESNTETTQNPLKKCWESAENFLRIYWEAMDTRIYCEYLLRYVWKHYEKQLLDAAKTNENQVRIWWESTEKLPKILRMYRE